MSETVRDFQTEATAAAMGAVAGALRDPTPDDIPRQERGSFVERLESVKEMIWHMHGQASRHGDRMAADALRTIADKINGIASDMALDHGKDDEE